jgi:membrane protein DedA with SNARE-associated domain
LINNYGLIAIFCLLMFGIAGIPVPDELIMTFAGYLISKGVLRPLPTIVTCCLGSVCGISLSYFLGYAVGIPLLKKYGLVLRLTMDKINLVHDWFNHIGKWTLMIGYFVPGVRHLTGFVAGVSKLEIVVFARYAYAGAFFWSITFLSIGFLLGNQWCKIRSHLYLISLLGIVLILAIITGYAIIAKRQQQQEDEIPSASKKASKQSG